MKTQFLVCALFAAIVTGCATAEPTLDTSPDAEVTFDGLVPVKNSAFKRAWADPDADLSPYTKIMPGPAEFEFRAVRKTGTTSRSSNQREFWISDKDKEKLQQVVSDVFNEELAKSTRFAMTDAPGPDVLIISGALLDIVSLVPPERAGRSEVYLSRVGEATLVLELKDSQSGETLVRAAERRAAERPGQASVYSSAVTTWAEVKRLARRWAVKLREGLDGVDTTPVGGG
ncbi:MAG: DUF3313 family protein [Gammaproteobacteria bacterium]